MLAQLPHVMVLGTYSGGVNYEKRAFTGFQQQADETQRQQEAALGLVKMRGHSLASLAGDACLPQVERVQEKPQRMENTSKTREAAPLAVFCSLDAAGYRSLISAYQAAQVASMAPLMAPSSALPSFTAAATTTCAQKHLHHHDARGKGKGVQSRGTPFKAAIKNRRRCETAGCSKIPCCNFLGQKQGRFCSAHKLEGMQDVVNRRCYTEGCVRWPNYGYPSDMRALFCSDHKLKGMINTKARKDSKAMRQAKSKAAHQAGVTGNKRPMPQVPYREQSPAKRARAAPIH
ncbi:unnamed protein product [Chrysoparadoxa australica]